MKSVMLYFGSFNPIHKGHIAVAEWILEQGRCDEVWFVVSPQNPLKAKELLIDEKKRFNMVELAISGSKLHDRMRACDIEFDMPRPSYTIDTLTALSNKYKEIRFSILVGSDIVGQIEKWREWQKISNNYTIYVYPRRGYPLDRADRRFVALENAPYEDFSSTQVRESLYQCGATGMVPECVKEYIKEHDLWITKEK